MFIIKIAFDLNEQRRKKNQQQQQQRSMRID